MRVVGSLGRRKGRDVTPEPSRVATRVSRPHLPFLPCSDPQERVQEKIDHRARSFPSFTRYGVGGEFQQQPVPKSFNKSYGSLDIKVLKS